MSEQNTRLERGRSKICDILSETFMNVIQGSKIKKKLETDFFPCFFMKKGLYYILIF